MKIPFDFDASEIELKLPVLAKKTDGDQGRVFHFNIKIRFLNTVVVRFSFKIKVHNLNLRGKFGLSTPPMSNMCGAISPCRLIV
jgi:hypothetical protein